MKKSLLLTTSILLVAAVAFATTLHFDAFNYQDGPLVGNGAWVSHSGTEGTLLVENGEAVVTQDSGSEDANLPFVPASDASKLYFRFDFTVDAPASPISGGDYEYFAHFKTDGTTYKAKMDIVAPSGGGDYSVGIATSASTADATWPTDLTYGVTYTVVALYDQGADIAQLWIDPVDESSPFISGADDGAPGTPMVGFALRQSSSSSDETIRVDNVEVSEDLNPVAIEDQNWGSVKSMFR